MKKLIAAFLLATLPVMASASGGNVHLEKANIDLSNQASLQNGAKLFVNYCLSCHSASYMRYSRMAADLGMTEAQVEQNLMFTTDKVGETMKVAMAGSDAKNWFGTKVPDLSVIGRSRGADWLYSYLLGFYLDDSRPFGVNNIVFPDVGMPHVLGDLQGWQKPVYVTKTGPEGKTHEVLDHLELAQAGSLSEPEYKRAVRDLVAYLVYMGEPIQLHRYGIGVWAILFLLVFTVLAYLMKKEFWKDIH
ncbi:MAG: cytochrome c1 [Chromatiales bacterium]|nr:cytochrome c1 [Chromatiales bacterium]